ncbi:hypothetical protein C4K22_3920 [Pseudomonas chlororaphis subsp. aurantiaca]|jgi:hypothetical protein|uniref:Transmembrane protein n=2 Tax=Pseudomonas chlororaphis TaxID=587753 RepID=A0AAJ1E225_9PSED|nr:hypothetical protein [Pseudomonas chlororaphis]AZD23068.1 hypothetical protein C4K24_3768 [Pseudomonas chlororaphis subsp. aurantiaca]AZD36660.1 hypothetical protein C4K22_3920 [Pseudomonas chlororaphis subsp. aurantiaca]AZD43000.1 hypothetical protein C4K21_3929 [Pseudomonas chlororaphis subsp. aurantiaca]AZD49235.1 hypothetical protein C4K20_3823 [Pseudomonas chlororaphis subsp. aurantiaca]MBU4632438.1 hypothetical protein [Pseudomonas chlororaphis subsp. aurantiaca]
MNAKVEDIVKNQDKTAKSTIPWGMIGSIILAITAPFFYLNGKAYHDGYLGYFKLEPSMFPLDTSATFVTAVVAWFHAMTSGLKGGMEFIGQHWLWASVACVAIILVFGCINYLLTRLTNSINRKRLAENKSRAPAQNPSLLKELGKCVLYIFIPSYGIFCAMFFISFILMTTITPFVFVGQKSAANDLQDGFKDSPLVTVTDPTGTKGAYRVMQCSTAFCALYADGKAIAVPVATLNWVVSDLSEKLPKAQIE